MAYRYSISHLEKPYSLRNNIYYSCDKINNSQSSQSTVYTDESETNTHYLD